MRLDNQELNFNFIQSGENIIRCSNVEEAFFNIFNITFDEQTSLLKSADKYIDGCPIIKLNVEHNNSVYEDIEFKVVVSENEAPCVFINENSLQNGYFFEPFENPSSVLEEQIELLADVVESSVEDEELVNEEIDWQELKQQSKQIQENKIAHLIKQVEHQLSSRIDESLHDARQGILAESINIQSKAQNSIEQKIENHTQHLNVLIEQWEQAAEAKISNYIINAIDETRCSIEEQFEVAVQEQQQDSLAVLSEKIAIIAIESKQAIADELVQIIEQQSNLLQETVATADDNIKQHVAQKLNEFKASITQNNAESFDAGVAGFINRQTEWLQQFVEGKIANVQESLEQSTIILEQKQDALAQKLTHHANEIVADASSKIIEQSKTLHQEQLQNVRQCVDEVISEQIAALQPTTEIIVTEARNTQKNLFKDAIGSIKTEMSSEMKAHVANLQQDLYKKFAIYAQSYAGGGSVAAQFADGGTMNGSLNVTNGQILSGGIDISTLFGVGGGGGVSGDYLPLSGGTMTGNITRDNGSEAYILSQDSLSIYYYNVTGSTSMALNRYSLTFNDSNEGGGSITMAAPTFNNQNYSVTFPSANGNIMTDQSIWGNTLPIGWADAMFYRDGAANTIAQRNSTNAQTFLVYNTYSNASNYERGFNRWNSNVFQIGTERLGTGLARSLGFVTEGVTRMSISSAGFVNVPGTLSATGGYIGGLYAGATAPTQTGDFGGSFLNQSGLIMSGNNGSIAWSNQALTFGGGVTRDLFLLRGAANTLYQVNGTNAQNLWLANTFTNSSNYERAVFGFTSNVLRIGTENLGTGVGRAINFITGGTTRMTISSAGAITVPSGGSFFVDGSGERISYQMIHTNTGLASIGGQLTLCYQGNHTLRVNNTECLVTSPAASPILKLMSGAYTTALLTGPAATDGTLELRNALTPQTFRISNTWSSDTNWEAAVIDWKTNPGVCRIGTDIGSAGGAAKALSLITGGVERINIGTTGNITVTSPLSTNQDVEITDATKGIILKSPNGTKYRVTVSDAGELTTNLI